MSISNESIDDATAPLPKPVVVAAERERIIAPALLAIGFAILIAISAGSVWLVQRTTEDSTLVEHTLEMEAQIYGMSLDLRRAESGQRGYLLTGREAYLDDYRNAILAIDKSLVAFRDGTADNPVQQRHVAELTPVVRQKLDELAETVRLRRDNQTEQALAIVNSDVGKRLMDQIRAISQRMLQEEQRLHELRGGSSQGTNFRLLLLQLAGIGTVLVLAAASIVSIRRSLAESAQAHRDLAVVNAGLEDTISERTADLREATEEIQRFAYIVSHDLRSPLVNIMGFTAELQALRDDLFGEMQRLRGEAPDPSNRDAALAKDFDEAIEFIRASTSKMDRLINAVLRLSREGKRDFTGERIDMTEMLKGVSSTMAHQAEEKGVKITVGDLPPATSDRLALEQVFSNLMDNALKYLRAGVPGQVDVTGRTTPLQLIYEVRDNGRGISPADHQRVFELFRRAGVQDTTGEGIGLAHVRAMVRRLGGTMSLKSQLGEGSTFVVTLPKYFRAELQRDRV